MAENSPILTSNQQQFILKVLKQEENCFRVSNKRVLAARESVAAEGTHFALRMLGSQLIGCTTVNQVTTLKRLLHLVEFHGFDLLWEFNRAAFYDYFSNFPYKKSNILYDVIK